MASTRSSRVNPKYKTKYRVQNWPEYERGLRARGDVTVWFSGEAIRAWTPPPNRRRGGQRRYSNQAILTDLTLWPFSTAQRRRRRATCAGPCALRVGGEHYACGETAAGAGASEPLGDSR